MHATVILAAVISNLMRSFKPFGYFVLVQYLTLCIFGVLFIFPAGFSVMITMHVYLVLCSIHVNHVNFNINGNIVFRFP